MYEKKENYMCACMTTNREQKRKEKNRSYKNLRILKRQEKGVYMCEQSIIQESKICACVIDIFL
jgi:hypothetical protein